MTDIFPIYKPFRNQLRRYELIDSLQLIWGLSRNFTFNHPIPNDIQLPNTYNPSADKTTRQFQLLQDFELEFLMKEMIINCSTVREPQSLKQIKNLAKLVNYVRKTLDNEITNSYLTNSILIEFNRLAHRQFIWQKDYHTSTIIRYYKLYSHKGFSKLFEEVMGIPARELMLIGIGFFYLTGKNFISNAYTESNVKGITNEMLNLFLSKYSIPIETLKSELKSNQEINENLFYTYNPLLATPLININGNISCPMPLLVYWSITSGLYYSLINTKGFENAFGNSFQDYIGEVISLANTNGIIKVLPEETYGKEEKRTTDWVLYDDTGIIFIECKTKRMTLRSKSTIDVNTENGIRRDLNKMAGFIIQLYKTFIEFKEGNYPSIKFNNEKMFYPVVVTLEEWFLEINPALRDLLYKSVVEKLRNTDMDASLVEQYPYYIISADNFENNIQIIQEKGINHFFDLYKSKKLADIKEYKNLFAGEFEKIFLKPIRS